MMNLLYAAGLAIFLGYPAFWLLRKTWRDGADNLNPANWPGLAARVAATPALH